MAASAYRAGVELIDERTGVVHDYTRRSGVESACVLLPGGETADRQQLWNAAEASEKRKDARTAREWLVALPDELTAAQRGQLARDFGAALADRYGVAVDIAIHLPDAKGDQRNHHAHMLTTTRTVAIGADGSVQLGAKTAIELGDKDRAKAGIAGRSADDITELRATWAALANAALARAGHVERIDHRSLADQGIDREPTVHLGPTATDIERRGSESDRGQINRDVHERNRARFRLAAERATVTREIDAHIYSIQEARQRKQMSVPDLRAEISQRELALPAPQAVVAKVDAVVQAEGRLKRLQKLQADSAGASVKATEQLYRWRVEHPRQAWLHDKGLWRSPFVQEQAAKAEQAQATRMKAEAEIKRVEPALHSLWGTEIGKVQAEQQPERAALATLKTELAHKVEIEAKAEAAKVAQARKVEAEVQPLIKDFVALAHSTWRAKAMPVEATAGLRLALDNYAKASRADKGDELMERIAAQLRENPEARANMAQLLAPHKPAIEQERKVRREQREQQAEARRMTMRPGPDMSR